MQYTRSLHLTRHLCCANAFHDPEVVSYHYFSFPVANWYTFVLTNVQINIQLLRTSVEGNFFISKKSLLQTVHLKQITVLFWFCFTVLLVIVSTKQDSLHSLLVTLFES